MTHANRTNISTDRGGAFQRYWHSLAATLLACLACAAFNATALEITLSAIDAGFVTEMGGSAKGDGTLVPPAKYNYSAGRELHYADGSLGMPPGTTPLLAMDRNNYFVFDLSGVSEPIIGASLTLFTGVYESGDPSETFDLMAPADPGAALADTMALAAGNAIGASEFDEPTDPLVSVAAALWGNIEGGPPALTTAIIDSSLDGSIIAMTFADLAYLNGMAGGPMVLGGSVSSVILPGSPQQPFGFTGPDLDGDGSDPTIPKLVLTFADPPGTGMPLPTTIALFGLGLCGLGFVRRWNFEEIRGHHTQ